MGLGFCPINSSRRRGRRFSGGRTAKGDAGSLLKERNKIRYFYRFSSNFQRQISAHSAHVCPVLRFNRCGRVFAPTRKPFGKRADNRFTGTQGTKVTNVFYTEFISSLTALSSLLTAEEGIYFASSSRVPLLRWSR